MKQRELMELDQGELLRKAREELDVSNGELANMLGIGELTLKGWLLPTTSKTRREMPKTARLLLGYILDDCKLRKQR
jgi:DNA-binding transcriptional regulator YiaG